MSDEEYRARVVQRAREIMAQGHYGWSWALAQAKEQVSKERGQRESTR